MKNAYVILFETEHTGVHVQEVHTKLDAMHDALAYYEKESSNPASVWYNCIFSHYITELDPGLCYLDPDV
jgi:hypothetical protein